MNLKIGDTFIARDKNIYVIIEKTKYGKFWCINYNNHLSGMDIWANGFRNHDQRENYGDVIKIITQNKNPEYYL